MPKNPGKHRLRNVLRAFCAAPWSILPGPMEAMLELLNHRAAGQRYTRDEIRQRIGYRERLLARLPATLALRPGPGGKSAARYPFPVTESGIALIPLDGVLAPRMDAMMEISGGTSTLQFASSVRQATADPEIKAIVEPIDSLGGQAVGLEEAAIANRKARDAKPTIAVAMGTMASAAYYIGASAGEVVAGWDSEVGSIGTVWVHQEFSQADKLKGTTTTVIKAGRYKFVGNSYQPLTAEDRDVLQAEVDAYHAQFIRSVAASRGVSEETVRERFGQGKTFIASEALKLGMIDRLGSLADVLAELEAEIAAADPQGRSAKAGLPGGDRRPTPSQPTFPAQETHPVDPKVFAALVAKGLVASEAKPDDAQLILNAFFAARGQKPPEGAEATVAALFTPLPAATPPPPPQNPAAIDAASPSESTAADRSSAAAVLKAERERVAEIKARGAVLMQTGVTQEEIDAAIANGTPVERFLREATARQVEVNPPIRPVSGGASIDKFSAAAVAALGERANVPIQGQRPAGTDDLRFRSVAFIAEECLRLRGERAMGTPEDIICRAIQIGGYDKVTIRGSAAGPQVMGPGTLPGIFGAIANASLETSGDWVEGTYKAWARPVASVPDFSPKTIYQVGEFGELPYHVDGKPFDASTLSEVAAWIASDGFGDEFVFTPAMMVADRLDVLSEAIRDKYAAHEATLNRLCVNLITANPLMLDGTAFFDDTARGNDIAAGGVPGDTEFHFVRLKLRAMKGPASKRTYNYTLKFVLGPEALETTIEKALDPQRVVIPATDANNQVWRGKTQWGIEPMLTDNSAAKWYGFGPVDRARSFIYVYQTGYEKMALRRYTNPATNSLHIQCEGRFGAACRNPKGVIRNAGSGRA